ncbi:MAG: membrane protein insertion efficiency factor YidD [Methyloligellaceae bacterium]
MTIARDAAKALLKAPIILYRYTFSAFAGRECRYLPTCSEYAEEAIEKNGAWKGLWLAMSRLCRCSPWGASGFDPVPDLSKEHHPLWAPWRYGRWSGTHIARELDNRP